MEHIINANIAPQVFDFKRKLKDYFTPYLKNILAAYDWLYLYSKYLFKAGSYALRKKTKNNNEEILRVGAFKQN